MAKARQARQQKIVTLWRVGTYDYEIEAFEGQVLSINSSRQFIYKDGITYPYSSTLDMKLVYTGKGDPQKYMWANSKENARLVQIARLLSSISQDMNRIEGLEEEIRDVRKDLTKRRRLLRKLRKEQG